MTCGTPSGVQLTKHQTAPGLIQKLVGHASPLMTLWYLAHYDAAAARASIKELARRFYQSPSECCPPASPHAQDIVERSLERAGHRVDQGSHLG